jgi:hypothetical protein
MASIGESFAAIAGIPHLHGAFGKLTEGWVLHTLGEDFLF